MGDSPAASPPTSKHPLYAAAAAKPPPPPATAPAPPAAPTPSKGPPPALPSRAGKPQLRRDSTGGAKSPALEIPTSPTIGAGGSGPTSPVEAPLSNDGKKPPPPRPLRSPRGGAGTSLTSANTAPSGVAPPPRPHPISTDKSAGAGASAGAIPRPANPPAVGTGGPSKSPPSNVSPGHRQPASPLPPTSHTMPEYADAFAPPSPGTVSMHAQPPTGLTKPPPAKPRTKPPALDRNRTNSADNASSRASDAPHSPAAPGRPPRPAVPPRRPVASKPVGSSAAAKASAGGGADGDGDGDGDGVEGDDDTVIDTKWNGPDFADSHSPSESPLTVSLPVPGVRAPISVPGGSRRPSVPAPPLKPKPPNSPPPPSAAVAGKALPPTALPSAPFLIDNFDCIENEEDNEYDEHGFPAHPDFTLLGQIGKGAFGVVYEARPSGAVVAGTGHVAIKLLSLDRTSDVLSEEAMHKAFVDSWKEITATNALRHPNILRFDRVFVHHKRLWIVLPLMTMGSLKDALQHKFPSGFKDNHLVATILRDMCLALEYLHRDGKLHKDLKAENILLSDLGQVMLSDFGCCMDLNAIDGALVEMIDEAEAKQRHALAAHHSPTGSGSFDMKGATYPGPTQRLSMSSGTGSLSKLGAAAAVGGGSPVTSHAHLGPASAAGGGTGSGAGGPSVAVPVSESMLIANAMTFAGSPCWMAPEVMEGKDGMFWDQSKVWSNALANLNGSSPYPTDFGAAGPPSAGALNDAKSGTGSPTNGPATAAGAPGSVPASAANAVSGNGLLSYRLYPRADIWSLGITALELAYGRPPHAGLDPMAMRAQLLTCAPPKPEYYRDSSYDFHKSYSELVASCLQKDPKLRPTASALLKHPFFTKYAKNSSYLRDKLVIPLNQLRMEQNSKSNSRSHKSNG